MPAAIPFQIHLDFDGASCVVCGTAQLTHDSSQDADAGYREPRYARFDSVEAFWVDDSDTRSRIPPGPTARLITQHHQQIKQAGYDAIARTK
jgi:hypothetical protein